MFVTAVFASDGGNPPKRSLRTVSIIGVAASRGTLAQPWFTLEISGTFNLTRGCGDVIGPAE
jgi:hypothetical protein